MDIEKLMELAAKSSRSDRADAGQLTLGYLKDIMSLLPPSMELVTDTGHQFGQSTIFYAFDEDGVTFAQSSTAHPSCYRGYYNDCTFNLSTEFGRSTVGHVISILDRTIGQTFQGYKGGDFLFSRSTLVWLGSSSFSSSGDSRMLSGYSVSGNVCTLLTTAAAE